MLCQFTFRNFRSYKAETTFDLQATAIPEFSDSLQKREKGGALLPVSVIYGPNGGGKSNLLRALSCLISVVVSPIRELEKNRQRFIIQHKVNCEPFLFDEESRNQPTEFEVFFRQGPNEYCYQLALLKDAVVSEALYWRALRGKKTGTVFERKNATIDLGAKLKRMGVNRSVNPKMPYLSFLAINYDIPVIAEVQKWFESCITRNYANAQVDQEVMIASNIEEQRQVIRALNDMDIDVVGYRFDKNENMLYTKRRIDGNLYELHFEDESDGTKKLIATLPLILLALREGRLVIVDELDAKLHPKLLRYVILMFKNEKLNCNGAQLLFTSHDMTTMRNTVFRRDEIWFSAANENHESEIYSLYEIRNEDNEHINNTAAYAKQYLEGRYGADPYLSNMLTGGDWRELETSEKRG